MKLLITFAWKSSFYLSLSLVCLKRKPPFHLSIDLLYELHLSILVRHVLSVHPSTSCVVFLYTFCFAVVSSALVVCDICRLFTWYCDQRICISSPPFCNYLFYFSSSDLLIPLLILQVYLYFSICLLTSLIGKYE